VRTSEGLLWIACALPTKNSATRLKVVEESLQRSERLAMAGRFAGAVMHESFVDRPDSVSEIEFCTLYVVAERWILDCILRFVHAKNHFSDTLPDLTLWENRVTLGFKSELALVKVAAPQCVGKNVFCGLEPQHKGHDQSLSYHIWCANFYLRQALRLSTKLPSLTYWSGDRRKWTLPCPFAIA